jgi:hypothetical protein
VDVKKIVLGIVVVAWSGLFACDGEEPSGAPPPDGPPTGPIETAPPIETTPPPDDGENGENGENGVDGQPSEDLEALIESQLEVGRILFNPPTSMRVGQKERIEARVSADLKSEISKGLRGRGTPIIERLNIGRYMSVRLFGTNFDITALSHENQIVLEDQPTQWEWDVIPLGHGDQELFLSASVRVDIPDHGTETVDYPVYQRRIRVSINPAYTAKRFVSENWQWLIGTLVLGSGLGAALLRRLRRRKPPQESEAQATS